MAEIGGDPNYEELLTAVQNANLTPPAFGDGQKLIHSLFRAKDYVVRSQLSAVSSRIKQIKGQHPRPFDALSARTICL